MPMPPHNAPPSNRRGGRRKGLRQACELVLPGRATRQVITIDTGIDGLSFHTARPIAPGTRCQVRFELPLPDRLAVVQGVLKTVYSSFSGSEGFKIGAVFTELREGSLEALREFIAVGP